MKYCPKCDNEKDESKFGKNAANEDGLAGYCLDCMREYSKLHRKNKPAGWERKTADIKAYQKEYREKNREHLKELQTAWWKLHPDLAREREKKRYERKMKHLHGDGYVVGKPENMKGAGFLTVDERTKARKARKAVSKALHFGRLVKQPCWCCGSVEVEAHHPDYDARLDVVWLCHDHHVQVHAEFRKIYVDIPDCLM
jgi:hypothetical protein